jgi:hypothetical protein
LQQHQLWRRGLPPYDETGGAPYTPKELGVAIDIAIKALDVQPTLIEALTDLIDCVETGGYEEVGSAVKSARASLAKAKGVQS